jgi:hypothetical protein
MTRCRVLERLSDGTEIAYWVVKYPWPMSSRDYVYARKVVRDAATGTIVMMSRACTHASMPPLPGMVRVANFNSNVRLLLLLHATPAITRFPSVDHRPCQWRVCPGQRVV